MISTNVAKTYWSSFFDWLYPRRCALCGLLGEESICEVCLAEFQPVDVIRREFDPLSPLELSANLFRYVGRPGQAVKRLKYSQATALAEPLSIMMAEGIERLGLTQYDMFVPVPIHWSRWSVRGFNQADLLCEKLEGVEWPLKRIRRTRQQAGLSREARMSNLFGAFRADHSVSGKSILLVDDVFTSGYTMRECAKTLREAGAVRVGALAFAGEKY